MPDEKTKRLCPDCEKEIDSDAKRCPHCGLAVAFYDEIERVAKVRAKHAPKESEKAKHFFEELFG